MRRSAHPSLSPQPRSPCPRRGLRPPTSHRTAARRAAGAAAKCSAPHACTHSTPRASAARSHPRPWTFRPFSQHLSLQVLGALRHRTQHRERARLIKRRNQSFALPSRILHHVSAVCHVKSWQGLIPKAHTHIRGGSDTTPPPTAHTGTHTDQRHAQQSAWTPRSRPAAPLPAAAMGRPRTPWPRRKAGAAHFVSPFPLNSLKKLPELPKKVATEGRRLWVRFFPLQTLYFQFLKATLARHIETGTVSKHSFSPQLQRFRKNHKYRTGSRHASRRPESATAHPPKAAGPRLNPLPPPRVEIDKYR